MTDDQLVFLLGAAVALYAYKPFVNIITALLAFVKVRIHKQRLYDFIEPLLKDKEEYRSIRINLTVKPRSYMHYLTFINKNVTYEKTIFNQNLLLQSDLKRLVPVIVIYIALPVLLFIPHLIAYIVGFLLVVVFTFIYDYYIRQNNAFIYVYILVRATINIEWENAHQPKNKVPATVNESDIVQNVEENQKNIAPKLPLPIQFRILKYIAIGASVLFALSIFGILLFASLKIIPQDDPIFTDITLLSLVLYVFFMGFLGFMFLVFLFAEYMYHQRPQ